MTKINLKNRIRNPPKIKNVSSKLKDYTVLYKKYCTVSAGTGSQVQKLTEMSDKIRIIK
jgi:hypothetical protein